jgi:hypothetical protein
MDAHAREDTVDRGAEAESRGIKVGPTTLSAGKTRLDTQEDVG